MGLGFRAEGFRGFGFRASGFKGRQAQDVHDFSSRRPPRPPLPPFRTKAHGERALVLVTEVSLVKGLESWASGLKGFRGATSDESTGRRDCIRQDFFQHCGPLSWSGFRGV